MAFVDVKWAPGYVYDTDAEISTVPKEIIFAKTGAVAGRVKTGQ